MKPFLHLVELNQIPIFQQLQWEEALLRADNRNWCLLNHGSPPAIVMGISGKMEQLVQQDKFLQTPIPLIRRFSGGGTVVADENTLFMTLICQSTALPVAPFPLPLLHWTGEIYRPLFPSYPFQVREHDYVIGERKWGGNAQAIIKGRWLHHSSLLWDYNPEHMDYLSIPPKTPAYRQNRPHIDFLCRLRDYLPSRDTFYTLLVEQLAKHFTLIQEKPGEIQQIATLPHRKVTSLEKNR